VPRRVGHYSADRGNPLALGKIMIQTLNTAWLYAYSPNGSTPALAYHTVFTGNPNGRAIFATVSLSHLTTLNSLGAGAWIRSVTPPFGPPAEFHDFAVNSFFAPQAIAVTFGLSARGSEAYAQGNVFFF
jgi:hypothetical protein